MIVVVDVSDHAGKIMTETNQAQHVEADEAGQESSRTWHLSGHHEPATAATPFCAAGTAASRWLPTWAPVAAHTQQQALSADLKRGFWQFDPKSQE